MRDEVLRMSNVTLRKENTSILSNFELSIQKGEILGLLQIDGRGADELTHVLVYNDILYNGCVYYCGQQVNSFRQFSRKLNRITLIGSRSSLIMEQDTLTNVFVLRVGTHQEILNNNMMERAFWPYMHEAGLEFDLRQPVGKLTAYEQVVIELLKGISMGNRLIVVRDIDTVLSDVDVEKFSSLVRHYANGGTSFLIMSSHLETLRECCGKIGIMKSGTVLSVLSEQETLEHVSTVYSAEFQKSVRQHVLNHRISDDAPEAVYVEQTPFSTVKGISFSVKKGECVCIQLLDRNIYDEVEHACLKEGLASVGDIYIGGQKKKPQHGEIAVLPKQPESTDLFEDLSFFDNIAMTMDHRYPAIWRSRKAQRNLRETMAEVLGCDLWDKSIYSMSTREKHLVLYARLLLQKPVAVVEFQPFHNADVTDRYQIWKSNEDLLKQGIALILVSVGLSDSLSIADRLIRIDSAGKREEYRQEDFGRLSKNIPWIQMYQ